MKTILVCLVAWCGLIHISQAQQPFPPTFIIKTDSAFFRLDSTYFQLLPDPAGTLSLKQVQQSPAFQYGSLYDPHRTAHTYWMRMRLQNALPHPLRLYYCDFDSDYIDLYRRDNTLGWTHQRTGDLVPYSELPVHEGAHERHRLFFTLAPNQVITVYQRAQNTLWHQPLYFLSPQLQTESERKAVVFRTNIVDKGWTGYYFAGIIVGTLFLAFCYNLYVYYSIRDRAYLFFSFSLLFFLLDRNNYYIQQAFFEEYPYAFKLLANTDTFFFAYYVLFIQSIRTFLQSAKQLPFQDRIVRVLLVVGVISNLLYIYSFSHPALQSNAWSVFLEGLVRLILCICVYIAYWQMKHGRPDARFVLLSIIPLLLLWLYTFSNQLLALSKSFAHLAFFNFKVSTFFAIESFCFGWLIVVFSGALNFRFNQSRKQVIQQAIEKEQLEKEREIERSRLIAAQNERLEQEVTDRTAALKQSLEELKAAQDQLVQKEKLASLGELTAGIAHEIQNPLNFVNNFAEVSTELVTELKEGPFLQLPDSEKDYADEIMQDLTQNLEKITHHGKRADSIVKGMLAHSRASSGQKQPTQLNNLVDEYLRIAYHGLRAKDKSFNADLVLSLDERIGLVNLVSQDIGRVLLNLFNNAFYAVQERQQQLPTGYKPTLRVQTSADADHITISVQDNGTGIPEPLLAKIFQPFFTTKPTGQGTGLGLSLSYDIITKGHGGKLTVQAVENEGTEFIIQLPA